ncbi:MAG: metal-dependent hydrolase [Nanoarchaeota archaeon]|nr:metal-dependent hydrolase [Nanoarchaeota archaeon]
MYPQTHFLTALFLALILVKLEVLGYYGALVCAILAVLMDLDHWIAFVFKKHKVSFLKAWNAATVKHADWERTFVHHKLGFGIVSVILLIFLLFNRLVFWVVGIAYYSHMFLDYVHGVERKKYRFRELGFFFEITWFELALDVVLLIGIVLILV